MPRNELLMPNRFAELSSLVGQETEPNVNPLAYFSYRQGTRLGIAGATKKDTLKIVDIDSTGVNPDDINRNSPRFLDLDRFADIKVLQVGLGAVSVHQNRSALTKESHLYTTLDYLDPQTGDRQTANIGEEELLGLATGERGGIAVFHGEYLPEEIALVIPQSSESSKTAQLAFLHPEESEWNFKSVTGLYEFYKRLNNEMLREISLPKELMQALTFLDRTRKNKFVDETAARIEITKAALIADTLKLVRTGQSKYHNELNTLVNTTSGRLRNLFRRTSPQEEIANTIDSIVRSVIFNRSGVAKKAGPQSGNLLYKANSQAHTRDSDQHNESHLTRDKSHSHRKLFEIIPNSVKEVEKLVAVKKPEVDVIVDRSMRMIERAREVLGQDFLGVEAISKLEQRLKEVGFNVEFVLDKLPPFPYTEEDLQAAKAFGEMLVLRPDKMLINGKEVPLTLIEFRELFHKKDPYGKMRIVVHSFETHDTWYRGEKFATGAGEIKLGWSSVKKDVLDGSTNTNWNDQKQLLKQYKADLKRMGAKNVSIRRRTCAEAVYDELLYYINTGHKLLLDKYDWTQTLTSNGYPVCVIFGSSGLLVSSHPPGFSSPYLGVCPSR